MDSLLPLFDIYVELFGSDISFPATPIRASIYVSLGCFLDHLLDVSRLLYFFGEIYLARSEENSLNTPI